MPPTIGILRVNHTEAVSDGEMEAAVDQGLHPRSLHMPGAWVRTYRGQPGKAGCSQATRK